MTTFTHDQFIAAYRTTPEVIQDAFASEKMTEIISSLPTTYALHVDVAGKLSEEIGYLLVGLTTPVDFLQRLGEIGIAPDASNKIATEINEKIFMPLRELTRNPDPAKIVEWRPKEDVVEESVEETPVSTPVVPAPVAPAPTYREPIPEPPPVSVTPPPIAQAPQWTPPYPQTAPPPPQFVPMPPGTYWVPVSIAQVPPTPPQAPAPAPVAPVAPPQPTPEVQPETPRPEPIPVVQPQWTAPANLPTGMPVTPPAPQIPITKEYGADPYREPV